MTSTINFKSLRQQSGLSKQDWNEFIDDTSQQIPEDRSRIGESGRKGGLSDTARTMLMDKYWGCKKTVLKANNTEHQGQIKQIIDDAVMKIIEALDLQQANQNPLFRRPVPTSRRTDRRHYARLASRDESIGPTTLCIKNLRIENPDTFAEGQASARITFAENIYIRNLPLEQLLRTLQAWFVANGTAGTIVSVDFERGGRWWGITVGHDSAESRWADYRATVNGEEEHRALITFGDDFAETWAADVDGI